MEWIVLGWLACGFSTACAALITAKEVRLGEYVVALLLLVIGPIGTLFMCQVALFALANKRL